VKRLASTLLLLGAAWIAMGTAPPAAQSPEVARLTILHTNDTHGRLLPFSYPAVAAPGSRTATWPSGATSGAPRGGPRSSRRSVPS